MDQRPSCAASSLARCRLPRLPYLACSRRTLKRQPPPPGRRCKLSHQRVVCRPRWNLKIPGPPAAMAGAPRRHVRLLDRVSAARRCPIQQPTSVNPGWAGGNQKSVYDQCKPLLGFRVFQLVLANSQRHQTLTIAPL